MKDGGTRLVFDTQELNADKAAALFSLKNQQLWLILVSSTTEQVEIPTEPPPEFQNQKSYSQRLRACLFRLWEQKGKPGDSESFYREYMEKVINWVKDRLEPEV